MKRTITDKLVEWKDNSRRKPLLLSGVRQCGKTYVLKDFGEHFFEEYVYLNFEADDRLKSVFDYDFDVRRILMDLSVMCGSKIEPGKTLLILDEIQECPRAVTSLKYFCENLSELHIACAGSLLGVAISRGGVSFPVGKVNMMQMYPLSFREFLIACGAGQYVEALSDWPVDNGIREVYSAPMARYLKEYYFVGGMPEAVSEWVLSHDVDRVEEVQDEILKGYSDDFAKHAPLNQVEKIRWIWDSVPLQLAKENNKFVFSHVKAGKRSAELEDALQWLRDAGLVYQLELVENPEIPLSSVADSTYFKVYLSDVGLLRRKSGLSVRTILEEDPLYMRYKGSLAENYALNEFVCQGESAYFWRSGNTAEVDLLLESEGRIIPVEVKSADHVQAKSYKQFCRRYSPSIGFKLSMRNLGENPCEGTRTVSLPLWMLWNWRFYTRSV